MEREKKARARKGRKEKKESQRAGHSGIEEASIVSYFPHAHIHTHGFYFLLRWGDWKKEIPQRTNRLTCRFKASTHIHRGFAQFWMFSWIIVSKQCERVSEKYWSSTEFDQTCFHLNQLTISEHLAKKKTFPVYQSYKWLWATEFRKLNLCLESWAVWAFTSTWAWFLNK